MSDQLTKLLSSASSLARCSHLPTGPAARQEHCDQPITGVRLSGMLARVLVIPQAGISNVHLSAFGDSEMAQAMTFAVRGGTFRIDGQLPYTGRSLFGRSSFVRMDGTSIINDVLYVDGREVDLDRALTLVLMVPSGRELLVREMIGPIGICDAFDGALSVDANSVVHLCGGDVRELTAELSLVSEVEVARVRSGVQASLSGGCVIRTADIRGSLKVSLSGGSRATFGAVGSFNGDVTGSGKLEAGAVAGTCKLSTSGGCRITLGSIGDFCSINGSGSSRLELGSLGGGCELDISGGLRLQLGAVSGDLRADMSGSPAVTADSVSGRLKVSGSGGLSVSVKRGTSRSASIDLSGSGSVVHQGSVAGDARVDISGGAHATLASVSGRVMTDISGSGYVDANGRRYTRRDSGW